MEQLQTILKFLRITDENGVLSITNLSMMASMLYMFQSPTHDLTQYVPVVLAFVNYIAKRYIGTSSTADVKAVTDQIDKVLQK